MVENHFFLIIYLFKHVLIVLILCLNLQCKILACSIDNCSLFLLVRTLSYLSCKRNLLVMFLLFEAVSYHLTFSKETGLSFVKISLMYFIHCIFFSNCWSLCCVRYFDWKIKVCHSIQNLQSGIDKWNWPFLTMQFNQNDCKFILSPLWN